MTRVEMLKIIAPKVIAVCLPLIVAWAVVEEYLQKRRHRNTVEQAVDTTLRASSAKIAALEAEGFRLSRIKGETWYFTKDASGR
jgi:hypothetical protein